MVITMNSKFAMSREDLYAEVWELSVKGVAEKYNLPYTKLLKKCKEADIPVPGTKYWIDKYKGVPVEMGPLPSSEITQIEISEDEQEKERKKPIKKEIETPEKIESEKTTIETTTNEPEKKIIEESDKSSELLPEEEKPESKKMEYTIKYIDSYSKDSAIFYDRKTLYREVWSDPVTDVAFKYGVSGNAIKKVCAALEIPVPPRGYWAKKAAGKPVGKIALPETSGPEKKYGRRSFIAVPVDPSICEMVEKAEEEVKDKVQAIANSVVFSNDPELLHPTIVAHKRKIEKYFNGRDRNQTRKRKPTYYGEIPLFAESISEEQLPRLLKIISSMANAVEAYGGGINENLDFIIDGELVYINATERQDTVAHVLSREEAIAKLEYEDRKESYSWTYEPKFAKYDYLWNGCLQIDFPNKRRFHDTEKFKIEERLPEIILALFEEVAITKRKRLVHEAEQRKRAEEERIKELKKRLKRNQIERKEQRIKQEKKNLNDLITKASSFSTANQIREFCNQFEKINEGEMAPSKEKYLIWAREKADCLDPLIEKEDPILGKIKIGTEKEEKPKPEQKETIVYIDKTVPYWYFK